MMVYVKQEGCMRLCLGLNFCIKATQSGRKTWLDLNPSLRLCQSNFLKSLRVSRLALECWTTKMQRGAMRLCQLTFKMPWSAKCCFKRCQFNTAMVLCVLLSGSLLRVPDCCCIPGALFWYRAGMWQKHNHHTAPQQQRGITAAEGLSKLRHWDPPEAALLLCWGCCIHLLPQVISPKHPAPTGCSAALQNHHCYGR